MVEFYTTARVTGRRRGAWPTPDAGEPSSGFRHLPLDSPRQHRHRVAGDAAGPFRSWRDTARGCELGQDVGW